MNYNIIKIQPKGKNINEKIKKIIDELGIKSSKAQNLDLVITSYFKFLNSNNVLYIIFNKNKEPIGYIKIGKKNLFYRHINGNINEISPLCILDFFILDKFQRKGYGNLLFNHILEDNIVHASNLGYDKPSNKFIKFLSKHHNLKNYIFQNNNFIIFDDYFKYLKFEKLDTQIKLNKEIKINLKYQPSNSNTIISKPKSKPKKKLVYDKKSTSEIFYRTSNNMYGKYWNYN